MIAIETTTPAAGGRCPELDWSALTDAWFEERCSSPLEERLASFSPHSSKIGTTALRLKRVIRL